MIRDELKAIQEVQAVPVEIPEWPGSWSIRMLSVGEVDAFLALIRKNDMAPARLIGRLFIALLRDGEQAFEYKDGEWLADKAFAFVQRVTEDIKRANGLAASSSDDSKKS